MSNFGLELALKKQGIKLLRTKVGDRYVTEALVAGYSNIGGEPSGHIVFLDRHTTGDGILTTLQVLSIMLAKNKPLSFLSSIMEPVPQKLINVEVKERPPMESIPSVQKALNNAKKQLGDSGRIVLRYSGTEPVARVMVEGTDVALVERLAQEIASAISESIGV